MAWFGLGAVISTVCYGITVRAAIGLGPLFAVQDGVASVFHITLGRAVMVVGIVVLALMAALGKRPGPGTFVLPFLQGLMLDAILVHLPTFGGWAPRVVAVIAASFLMCLGGALVIESGIGMSALDGVMMGLHGRTGRRVTAIRMTMEAALLLVGWLLGGAVGAGTVITGLLVGPSMQFWLGVLVRLRSTADVTPHAALTALDW